MKDDIIMPLNKRQIIQEFERGLSAWASIDVVSEIARSYPLARKIYWHPYSEFFDDVSRCKLMDRLRIAWQVIKGGKYG